MQAGQNNHIEPSVGADEILMIQCYKQLNETFFSVFEIVERQLLQPFLLDQPD